MNRKEKKNYIKFNSSMYCMAGYRLLLMYNCTMTLYDYIFSLVMPAQQKIEEK